MEEQNANNLAVLADCYCKRYQTPSSNCRIFYRTITNALVYVKNHMWTNILHNKKWRQN